MTARISVRNLNPEIVNKLNELATINERSLEGEVRYALSALLNKSKFDRY